MAAFEVGATLAQGCVTTGRSMNEDACALKDLKEVFTDCPGVLVSWDIEELIPDIGEKSRGESGPWETVSWFDEGWLSSGCVMLRSSALGFGVNETDWSIF